MALQCLWALFNCYNSEYDSNGTDDAQWVIIWNVVYESRVQSGKRTYNSRNSEYFTDIIAHKLNYNVSSWHRAQGCLAALLLV